MRGNISFLSSLPLSRREELADLMFFNIKQDRFRNEIIDVVERYGVPEIVADGRVLRFRTDRLGTLQSLIVTDGTRETGRLLGVALYYRVSKERLVLLHISVRPEYAHDGSESSNRLALRLIEQVRRIGRSIRGVEELEILYVNGSKRVRL